MKAQYVEYRGFQIRKSGKTLYKVMQDGKQVHYQRYVSVEAAKCAIDATVEHRVYTPQEHATVYPNFQEWIRNAGKPAAA